MVKITGTLIKNYYHCKRQAWLYSKGLNFRNELTKIGHILHEENESKEFIFENLKIDDFDFENKILIEYKKSSSNIEGSIMQVIFYLNFLKNKGLDFKGKIKDIDFGDEYLIELNEENITKFENLKKELNKLLNEKIPSFKKIKECNNCSFYDYCYS